MATNSFATAPSKGRRRLPATPKSALVAIGRGGHIEASVRTIASAHGIQDVRTLWRRQLRTDPPPVQSADLLIRLLTWHVQAEAYGDLDEVTAMRLVQVGRSQIHGTTTSVAAMAALETGTVLIREWRNVEYRVLVLDEGFEHRGRRYRTLSEIARSITGTKWSGPRFFGVEQK